MRRFDRSCLIVAHEADQIGGEVARCLGDRGFSIHTHLISHPADPVEGDKSFPNFADYDLIVVMGSIRSLTNKDEIASWVYDELDAIRATFEADKPLLGVCFGAQLIADALGGAVEASPQTEIGWFTIDDAPGQSNPVGPGPWLEWHHDRIIPPPNATVLAQNETAPQLFTIGRFAGTQFHPEANMAQVTEFLSNADPSYDEYFAEYGVDRELVTSEMAENEARNSEQCRRLVDWFLDDVAFPESSPPEPANADSLQTKTTTGEEQ